MAPSLPVLTVLLTALPSGRTDGSSYATWSAQHLPLCDAATTSPSPFLCLESTSWSPRLVNPPDLQLHPGTKLRLISPLVHSFQTRLWQLCDVGSSSEGLRWSSLGLGLLVPPPEGRKEKRVRLTCFLCWAGGRTVSALCLRSGRFNSPPPALTHLRLLLLGGPL